MLDLQKEYFRQFSSTGYKKEKKRKNEVLSSNSCTCAHKHALTHASTHPHTNTHMHMHMYVHSANPHFHYSKYPKLPQSYLLQIPLSTRLTRTCTISHFSLKYSHNIFIVHQWRRKLFNYGRASKFTNEHIYMMTLCIYIAYKL